METDKAGGDPAAAAERKMKEFRQLDMEDGNEKGAARWGERVRALEQVQEKIRRAKWR